MEAGSRWFEPNHPDHMTELFPYQKAGVSHLAGRRTALLADDPGLGKTLQAIRACDAAMVLKVLVIAPAGVVENWKREIQKYRRGDWQAVVVSYDKAAGSDHALLLREEWDVLILDEGHFLKTLSSRRTSKIYGKEAKLGDDALASRAAQVWVLSGTPMPNDPSELYTHLRALHVDSVLSERTGLPWTFHQFMHAYCTMKSTGFGMKITGSRNEAKLNKKLDGFMLRRRKGDVLKDLPPLRFGELWLEGDVTGVDFEEAEVVRKTLAEKGAEGLRSIVAHVGSLRRITGMAKALPAAQWVNDWLDSTPVDKKIVVFAHHTEVIETLFDKLHVRAVRVSGASKQGDRQRAVDRLQTDPAVRVFLGQITAAGTGITLTKASDLLFVESSWVPAEVEQAAMRIHRIGQTEPCLVRFAMLAGTIDEDIQRAIARKTASIAAVVDGV